MGAEDVERQQLNVFRMQLMGAEVVPVESGGRTLKDAINEALRDWSASFETTHYLLGTAAGPHPFPTMVREFQRVIGREARAQILEQLGRLPDAVVACVGGGSNAIGLFADFLDDDVRLIGVEAAGKGLDGDEHGATLLRGTARHPPRRRDLCAAGRATGRSPTPGRSRPGSIIPRSGPSTRISRTAAAPNMSAPPTPRRSPRSGRWPKSEGIICAFESAHALAHALKLAEERAGQRHPRRPVGPRRQGRRPGAERCSA